MGDLDDTAYGQERPIREVMFTKAFAVGKYEVTFSEWDFCAASGGCERYRPSDALWGRGQRPVINVSWQQASAYTEWLSQYTGQNYRLLSEAEWEYVARAGSKEVFPSGRKEGQLCRYGNVRNGSCVRGTTLPVGQFDANAFALHDLMGNAAEWVADCWHDNYDGAPKDGSVWRDGGDCSRHVLRGGYWASPHRYSRSAARTWYLPTGHAFNAIGFRVAKTLN